MMVYSISRLSDCDSNNDCYKLHQHPFKEIIHKANAAVWSQGNASY